MKKLTLLTFLMSLLACADNQAQEKAVEEVKATAEKKVEQTAEQMSSAAEKKAEEAQAIAKSSFDDAKKVETKVAEKMEKATADYQAGIHYEVLSPVWDTEVKDEVVVYEFFGYLCPHCNTFQPYMHSFEAKKADNVKLVRVPVIFQPMWKIYAQSYYTAEAMGLLEQTHQAMFDAIHKQRRQFRSIEQIADWYASSFGVDREKFLSTANSFVIDNLLRKSDKMMRAMDIRSTPTVVVDGKFKPKADALKTRAELMQVVDFLVEEQRKSL
ncbi:DsbA family protein [Marinicella sp. W31]|uniref:thiol:disulfide interchange protein DsbA/DsbL n=1 Tax=Marinicella sp. W31 TaxID=3023713 RepID=UPI0037570957